MAKRKNKNKNLYELKEDLIEDVATAIENDEVANDPLEDLEETNGKIEDEVEEEYRTYVNTAEYENTLLE